MAWTNSDGLIVEFGIEKAAGMPVGAHRASPLKMISATLEVAKMDTTGGLIGGTARGKTTQLPIGSSIVRAILVVTESFAGASGTLDLGVANADGSYTNLDEDGIDVAIAVATLLAGTVILCDGALVGAGADRDLTVEGFLSYDIDTTDFTAGKATLLVEYLEPMYPDQGAA